MRHLIGIVLAIVMAGVLFFAGAWGYLRLLGGRALPAGGGSLVSDHRVIYGLAAVAGTGLLAGILVGAPRISPLAAGLPGLLLLGWTGLYVASATRAINLIPLTSHSFGAGFKAMLVNGIAGAAGLGMVIPLFVPSRWRSSRSDEAESTDADADEHVSSMIPAAQPAAPAEPAGRPLEPASVTRPQATPYGAQDYGTRDYGPES